MEEQLLCYLKNAGSKEDIEKIKNIAGQIQINHNMEKSYLDWALENPFIAEGYRSVLVLFISHKVYPTTKENLKTLANKKLLEMYSYRESRELSAIYARSKDDAEFKKNLFDTIFEDENFSINFL